MLSPTLAAILPSSARVEPDGHLSLAGWRVSDLVARYGTPLYVYDEAEVRAACRSYTAGQQWTVHYAAKAFLAPFLCAIVRSEGLHLDVVSGGELAVALAGGYRGDQIRFHGNNKSVSELGEALDADVAEIVLDNADELERLAALCVVRLRRQRVLLRLAPGIAAHTHDYLQTGRIDSKFGFSVVNGDALAAVTRLVSGDIPLDLIGYHAHIGTQIMEVDAYLLTMRTLLDVATQFWRATMFWPSHLCAGGGAAISYTHDDITLAPPEIAMALSHEMATQAAALGLPVPSLSVEPGRSIVGRAGVALYTVGGIKEMPGRRYVVVDGGMADNIRPPLYQARYTVLPATQMYAPQSGEWTVAGRYCEGGDILASDVPLPALQASDLLALPAAGAYCLPMSSNYNMALRPAVVVLSADGQVRLVQRRETYADLLRLDM